MKDIDIRAFELHFKSGSFRRKVERARSVIEQAFSTKPPKKWYVALSGGKDSTIVFDLVMHFEPGILAMWSDEEFFLPETLAYIERLQQTGANIRRIKGPIKHMDWFISNQDSGELGKTATAKSLNLDGVFMGLRAEENSRRKVFLAKNGPLYFVQNRDIWYCNPIAWWTAIDVWAYIFGEGLDYNRAYDKLAAMGLPLGRQRIGPFITERAPGALAIIKAGWPEEYQRFIDKYPQGSHFT